MSSISELISRLEPHRKRLAALVLVIGVVVVGLQIKRAMPRPLTIHYDLGPDRGGPVREVRLAYLPPGATEARGVLLTWPEREHPNGAPRRFTHEVELSPGRYTIEAHVAGAGFANDYTRALRVPTDGEPRIELFDAAFADGKPEPTVIVAGWAPTPP